MEKTLVLITLVIVAGVLFGLILIVILKSIYLPGARKIQAIMLFGKLYTIIANIEGKKIFTGESIPRGNQKWDIVDLLPGEEKRSNIYFFLWPFFTLYKYPLNYVKEKKIGEEHDDDVVIWTDQKSKTCLISRSGISDHLEWRVEYPTVTSNLDTEELASVDVYTNNMIETKNPSKALFGIKDWAEAMNEILYGGLRGLVSEKKMYELNQFSKNKDSFNDGMKNHCNNDMGLGIIGFELVKSIFKDFNPADDTAKLLMKSYTDVEIAEQTGKAEVITAKKEAKATIKKSKGKAKAHAIEQEPIVFWKKKYLVDTGLAKTDAAGNITELVPDANTKITAEAIKEWSKITGTLVADAGSINKIFSISSKKEE